MTLLSILKGTVDINQNNLEKKAKVLLVEASFAFGLSIKN